MKIICFGDSNTYGYDPRSYIGGRYGPENRWVDLLAQKTGWTVINEGMNGREIPRCIPALPEDTDLLIVMLGVNDLLQGNCVEAVVHRMRCFMSTIAGPKLVLIVPPPMERGEWVTEDSMIEASKELSEAYLKLAHDLGVSCVDARHWNIPMTYDGVHFTEEGHRMFAEKLFLQIK